MKIVCISASNMAGSGGKSVSCRLCQRAAEILAKRGVSCEILDLRDVRLSPCTGCGQCFDSRRCCCDSDFNALYDAIVGADALVLVSPHYAPIPARLCMLLEKMEEITFLHWWRDGAYRSELYGLPVGVISHGGGGEWALASYKAMVNDTIANALDTIQCRVVPFDGQWATGLSLPVAQVHEDDSIFPAQEYDWPAIETKLTQYMERILETL